MRRTYVCKPGEVSGYKDDRVRGRKEGLPAPQPTPRDYTQKGDAPDRRSTIVTSIYTCCHKSAIISPRKISLFP